MEQEDIIKSEAVRVAKDLLDHAQETARQMLLTTNLDISKIPLICNKIVDIQSDVSSMQKTQEIMKENQIKNGVTLWWIQWLVVGMAGGIGALFVAVIGAIIMKVL